mgnify:CR=1 FL=1
MPVTARCLFYNSFALFTSSSRALKSHITKQGGAWCFCSTRPHNTNAHQNNYPRWPLTTPQQQLSAAVPPVQNKTAAAHCLKAQAFGGLAVLQHSAHHAESIRHAMRIGAGCASQGSSTPVEVDPGTD